MAAAKDTAERDEAHSEFKDAVNMTASRLEKWLDSDQSKNWATTRSGADRRRQRPVGRNSSSRLKTRTQIEPYAAVVVGETSFCGPVV